MATRRRSTKAALADAGALLESTPPAEPAPTAEPKPPADPTPAADSAPTADQPQVAAAAPVAAPMPWTAAALPDDAPPAATPSPAMDAAPAPASAIPLASPASAVAYPTSSPASPIAPPGATALPPGVGGPTAGEQASELARETFETVNVRTRAFVRTLDPTGIRPTLIVAAIIAALVLGTQLLNGVIATPGPRFGPNPGVSGPTAAGSPVEVNSHIRFRIAAGWQPQQQYTDDLPGVVLQKGNAFLEARATRGAFGGQLGEFLTQLTKLISGQLSGYQATQPSPTSINGLGGLRIDYAGTNKNGNVQEGELTVVMTADGTAFMAHAFGQQGSVSPLLGEVRDMLSTLEVH